MGRFNSPFIRTRRFGTPPRYTGAIIHPTLGLLPAAYLKAADSAPTTPVFQDLVIYAWFPSRPLHSLGPSLIESMARRTRAALSATSDTTAFMDPIIAATCLAFWRPNVVDKLRLYADLG